MPAGREGAAGASTNPWQPPAVRPEALLSLTQQQDELQGTRMLQGPQALLGKMVFIPWDRSCRCRVLVAQSLTEPEQSRRGKIYRGKKSLSASQRDSEEAGEPWIHEWMQRQGINGQTEK